MDLRSSFPICLHLKLYKQRGSKRIIEIYDESLKKNILLGNENIRSLDTWQRAFQKEGFNIEKVSSNGHPNDPYQNTLIGYILSFQNLCQNVFWKQTKK